tara:strand:- start:377 stop:553 length:177 start_codon:yes stop_codon:yes gene_type:complete
MPNESVPRDTVTQEKRWDEMTREGIADADAGQLVDHAHVREWAMSLGTQRPLPLPQPR